MNKGIISIIILVLTQTLWASKIEKIVENTETKVVKIGIIDKDGRKGVCSGSFITSKGLVLTCAHCFEHGIVKKIFIKRSTGQYYPATLVDLNTAKDLALIEPNIPLTVPYFHLGKQPKIGQQVMSFGSPLGIQHTATVGWVVNILDKLHMVVHSAFINPGNSGGPLVDMHGNLIGVNEAMLRLGFFELAHGLYMAINLQTIKEFVNGRNE